MAPAALAGAAAAGPVLPVFQSLPEMQARQLTTIFQRLDKVDSIGQITALDGGIRVELHGMTEATMKDAREYPIRGFHATDVPGLCGILEDGFVRPTRYWNMVFYHGRQNVRSAQQVQELYRSTRSKMPSDIYFEIAVQTRLEWVQYGGHDAEEAAVAQAGTTRYGHGRASRWCSHPSAVEVRALWLSEAADIMAELEAHLRFRL